MTTTTPDHIHHHGHPVSTPLDCYLLDGLDAEGLFRIVNVDSWSRQDLPLTPDGVTDKIRAAPIFRSRELTGQPHPETGTTDSATLGVDLLYVPAGESFPPHIHPGHHLLMSVRGLGSVTYGDELVNVLPGDIYFIQADVAHAVGSDPDGPGHWLLSFGAPHKRVEAADRMRLVDAAECLADPGEPGWTARAERFLRRVRG